jgi:hypothetical protein
MASARFPKFVFHLSGTFAQTSESHGHSSFNKYSTVYRFEVPEENPLLAPQGFQIGGTGAAICG